MRMNDGPKFKNEIGIGLVHLSLQSSVALRQKQTERLSYDTEKAELRSVQPFLIKGGATHL